ncbi:disulfide bond formation protein B [Bacillus sp. FJAT-49711]|uniref:disulfide oxidoreductase n=1 Tax=Bacillus sp. FJAT-49711 TaxID=2833585 RepID=UPI001BC97A02|nr:disulfide oxidoreductase [Bacillus sp. FJAT-49711]MBS4218158.1 disulfide bond formation protein B [Bacillus sp. FJAT-49711]
MNSKNDSRDGLMFFAFAISVIALLGSLYFSEVRKYMPCELCWYIRIIMYPIALILGIATVRKDYKAALYSAAFSGIGIPVSLYLYLIQKVPSFADSVPACGVIPCTTQYINWLGFITIPFLALMAFILIFISSIFVMKRTRRNIS